MDSLGGLIFIPAEPGNTEKMWAGCKSKHKGHISCKIPQLGSPSAETLFPFLTCCQVFPGRKSTKMGVGPDSLFTLSQKG